MASPGKVSEPSDGELNQKQDRRDATRAAIARSITRAVASVVGLFLAYGLLPLEGGHGRGGLLLVLGLLIFVLTVAWQVRAILRSRSPVLRGIEAVAIALPLFLLIFAATYVVMSHHSGAFAHPLNHIGGFYFATTVFATVGFGDIVPVSDTARVVVTGQMLGDLIFLGVVLKLLVGAVRRSRTGERLLGEPSDKRGP